MSTNSNMPLESNADCFIIGDVKILDMNNQELKLYQEDLERAANWNSESLFTNGGPEHAAILLSTIFKHTKKELYIYGASLRATLTSFDVYWNALSDCIKRGVQVNVLLEDEDENAKSPVRKCLEKLSSNLDNVKVRSAKNLPEIMSKYLKNATHFTVADARMFRLEYDRDNFKAFGSLNNQLMSRTLKNAFEEAFNNISLASL